MGVSGTNVSDLIKLPLVRPEINIEFFPVEYLASEWEFSQITKSSVLGNSVGSLEVVDLAKELRI